MKLRTGLILALAMTALCGGRAVAQEDQSAAPGKWVVDLGAAVRLRPSHIGANTYQLDLLPVLEAAYGKRVHISVDDGVRWTALKQGRLSLGPVIEYRQAYNDLRPPRSTKVDDALEAGVFSQVNLTYAVLEGRFRKALNAYYGYSGDLSLDTLAPLGPHLGLGLEARLGWADGKFTRAQFGQPLVTTRQTGQFWSGGLQAGLIYRTSSGYRLVLGVSDDEILRPTRGSSSYRTRNTATLGLALSKRFMSR